MAWTGINLSNHGDFQHSTMSQGLIWNLDLNLKLEQYYNTIFMFINSTFREILSDVLNNGLWSTKTYKYLLKTSLAIRKYVRLCGHRYLCWWFANDFHSWLRHSWNLWQITSLAIITSFFTVTHTLFYISFARPVKPDDLMYILGIIRRLAGASNHVVCG